jgi:hypothetical protein
MSEDHNVISAFIDDEPFDAHELAAALSDPAGRELLIDLVALRGLATIEAPPIAAGAGVSRRGSPVRLVWAAAAVVLAMAGGYRLGQQQSDQRAVPPTATVVVAGTAWQVVSAPGGGR